MMLGLALALMALQSEAGGGGGPPPASDVAFVAGTTQISTTTSGTTFNSSVNHTVGSGANRVVVVTFKAMSNVLGEHVMSNVLFGGVAMTQAVASIGGSSKEWTSAWYIINPAAGASALTATVNGSQLAFSAYTQEFTSVSQSAPIRFSLGYTNGSLGTTLATPRTTEKAGNMVLGSVCIATGALSAQYTVDSGATVVVSETGATASSDVSVGDSRKAMPAIGAGGHTWSWTTSDRACGLIIELEAA